MVEKFESSTSLIFLPSSELRKNSVLNRYIQMIINANPNGKHLVILDARPSVNAKANRVKGGGYEEEYPRCTLQFMDIQNIHSIRRSMMALKVVNDGL